MLLIGQRFDRVMTRLVVVGLYGVDEDLAARDGENGSVGHTRGW